MIKKTFLYLLIVLLHLTSCASTLTKKQVSDNCDFEIEANDNNMVVSKQKWDEVTEKMIKSNVIIEINDVIDLNGAIIKLGKNNVLKFNGGSLCNGTLIGNNTKIEGDRNGIFDALHFKGTWLIPKISTDMWKNLNYPNSLQDVFSLQNSKIQNKLIIERSNYNYVLIARPNEGILNVLNNTELIINGSIILEPNDNPSYEMIRISKCNNVKIHGKGIISGDRLKHDYTTINSSHEWGFGIIMRSSTKVDISGITLNDFTGDAITLMDNCSNIKLHDLVIKDCRSTAICIRADHEITIDNCTISGIINDKYNEPCAAVDIEPVIDCTVHNIMIRNCSFKNNVRGISSHVRNYYGGMYKKGDKTVAEGRRYVNLEIKNCQFKNSTYTSFICPFGWENVSIKDCTFYNGRQEDIRVGYTKKCVIENCHSSCDDDNGASKSRCFVTTFYDNRSVIVERCSGNNMKKVFNDNKNCKLTKSEFKTIR